MKNLLQEIIISKREKIGTKSSKILKVYIPLLTLRPRLLFTRKGSITLKCLETKGCPGFSWPPGKTAYTELHASRNNLLRSKSPPSLRGGSAVKSQKH